MAFVRWQSSVPNLRGRHIGVFGLANGLARAGRLSVADQAWWRVNNDWFDAACPDPALQDPSLFDRTVHPVATCWFRDSAAHLLDRVPGYLELLDRYDVSWVELRSSNPGRILYEDAVQVVVGSTAESTPSGLFGTVHRDEASRLRPHSCIGPDCRNGDFPTQS